MKRTCSLLILACTGLMLAPAVLAGDAEDRAAMSRQLIDRWDAHVQEAHRQPAAQWSKEMMPLLKAVPLADLRKAVAADDFTAMNDALLGRAVTAAGGDATQAFGDADTDLIYVPVNPCRIIDTRVAGGPITANSTRNFDVTATSTFASQGGESNDCGIGSVGSFAAAVINFTVVTPSAAGYITAFPYLSTQPLAATVNYTAGDIRGNLAAVKLDQGASAAELSVYTFAQTHLVADVVGYFKNPPLPSMQCVTTANTISNVNAGATSNTVAPACAVGYQMTGTNCEASTWQMPFVFVSDGTCSAQNNSSGTAQLRASRRCCQVTVP